MTIVMLHPVGREGYARQQEEGHLQSAVGNNERGIPDGGDTVVMGGFGGEIEAKDLEGTGEANVHYSETYNFSFLYNS